MTHEQINKEFSRKVKAGIFNPVRRHLTNGFSAEDRWQEAVALTWLMFMRYAAKGKVLDDALLVRKCKWTATDLSRRFVPAGDTQPYKDALDPRAYRDGRVTVHRLDGIDDEHEGDRALEIGLAEAMAASPERKLHSAHDLQQWVGDLSFRDQAIMELVEMVAIRTAELVVRQLEARVAGGPSQSGLLPVKQAAAHLSLSPSTIYKLSSAGELSSVKLGGRLCFRREDLDAYVSARCRGKGPALVLARQARTARPARDEG